MREIVRAAKALSDETRLRILNLLLQRECCVCEVMRVLDISQTRASRNLNILYAAGFLKLRRQGLWAYYSIDGAGPAEYLALFLIAVKRGLKENRVAARDRRRLKDNEVQSGATCDRPAAAAARQ
jgi:ArsR family transcriptional regulator, arsenate/arsenite/antimonite-responsive transcriptional repressor